MKLQIETIGLLLLILSFSIFWKQKLLFIKPTQLSSERSSALDFVRGLAMIGIVSIHIDSYFSYYHPNDFFLQFTRTFANLSRFSVPVFIFSSALFLKWKDSSQYWSGKISNLLFPFLLFSILGYFTKYPVQSGWGMDLLYRIAWGKVFEPYYYVPLLFQFYLLYALFFRFQSQISSSRQILYIFISLLINLASNHYFPTHTETLRNLENISFTNFLFFFTVGFYSRDLFSSKEGFLQFWNKNIYMIFLGTTLFFIGFTIYSTIKTGFSHINHFLFYPFTMLFLLFFAGIKVEEKKLNENWLYSTICKMGEKSLAIFLLHPIIIHLMHAFDPYSMFGPIVSWFITLLLNTMIPLLLWKYLEPLFPKWKFLK
jgi:peptidoglycan/LPS O-acetylase OafA/YrhL